MLQRHAQLLSDQAALQQANEASIEQLTAHRSMLNSTLLAEIRLIEEDSHFSLTHLLQKLRDMERRMEAAGGETECRDHRVAGGARCFPPGARQLQGRC